MAASAPRPCFFVHKNPSLNFPSFHPLTISNFRLLPSGTLSWNRMRRLLSQPNWFCSFSSSQFPAQPKKNRQLQKIGFVSLSLSQRDRPSGKCGRTGSPPPGPPYHHPSENWLRFVKRLPATFPNPKKSRQSRKIGFVSSNLSQWDRPPGLSATGFALEIPLGFGSHRPEQTHPGPFPNRRRRAPTNPPPGSCAFL